jgi:hypothetical protein
MQSRRGTKLTCGIQQVYVTFPKGVNKMVRVVLARITGAFVAFAWGMVAWMVLPLHTPSVRSLSNEQAIVDAMLAQDAEAGFYEVPNYPGSKDRGEDGFGAAEKSFVERHREGPLATIIYQPEGEEPMAPPVMFGGLMINFVSATLAAALLSGASCCQRYWQRVVFVACLGLFAALVTHLSYWNWMRFPLDFTLAMMVDVVAGWTLVGLAMAAIVRPGDRGESKPEIA